MSTLHNRLGVSIHQANDPMRLNSAVSLGVEYWRGDFNWYDINPAPDVWAWDYFDAMVAGAQAHGCSIAALVGGTPDWANGGLGRTYPPTEIHHWQVFLKTVAERYHGKIQHWLLWNEPNRGYWSASLQQYVQYIVRPGVEVLKSVDPQCIIGAPELSTEGSWDVWLREFIKDAGSLVDILTVHCYAKDGAAVWSALTQARRWWELWRKPSIKQVVEQAGWGGPVWVMETGFSDEQGEDVQARAVDQLLERLLGAGWPAGLAYFQLIDDDNSRQGLFRADGTPKPAAEVVRRYAARVVV